MAEYSRIAKGHFVSTGAQQMVNLPFLPDAVEIFNYSAAATPAQYGVPFAYWDDAMGQGFAMADVFNATPALSSQVFVLGGISTFSAGLALQYGPQVQIISATAANPPVFTVAANVYSVGDVVTFQGLYQSPTTGMAQMSGMSFVVTAVSPTTFTVDWDASGSNYTALSGSPVGAFVKKILYPSLYVPGVSFIEAITLGTSTIVDTTSPHNLSVGSEVAFFIPPSWGTVQLNSLPNVQIPGSPRYGYVIAVNSPTEVVVNINSSLYSAFNANQTISSVPGLSFPQMYAVGDVNTGGQALYSGSPLYPSPLVNGVPTINGPAINGAFINNTSAGFIVGNTPQASAVLVGAPGNIVYWRAFLSDFA